MIKKIIVVMLCFVMVCGFSFAGNCKNDKDLFSNGDRVEVHNVGERGLIVHSNTNLEDGYMGGYIGGVYDGFKGTVTSQTSEKRTFDKHYFWKVKWENSNIQEGWVSGCFLKKIESGQESDTSSSQEAESDTSGTGTAPESLILSLRPDDTPYSHNSCSTGDTLGELSDDETYYCAMGGDSLSGIFNTYGNKIDADSYEYLVEINGIKNPDRIDVGQKIYLSQPSLIKRAGNAISGGSNKEYYTVVPEDTLTGIYNGKVKPVYGTSLSYGAFIDWNVGEGLIDADNLNLIEVGQKIIIRNGNVATIQSVQSQEEQSNVEDVKLDLVIDSNQIDEVLVGSINSFANFLIQNNVKVIFEKIEEKNSLTDGEIIGNVVVRENLNENTQRFIIFLFRPYDASIKYVYPSIFSRSAQYYQEMAKKEYVLSDLDKQKFPIIKDIEDKELQLVYQKSSGVTGQSLENLRTKIQILETRLNNLDNQNSEPSSDISNNKQNALLFYGTNDAGDDFNVPFVVEKTIYSINELRNKGYNVILVPLSPYKYPHVYGGVMKGIGDVQYINVTSAYPTSGNDMIHLTQAAASSLYQNYKDTSIFVGDSNAVRVVENKENEYRKERAGFNTNVNMQELLNNVPQASSLDSSAQVSPGNAPCFDPLNVGKIGTSGVCNDMLIVSGQMLRDAEWIDGGKDRRITKDGVDYTFGNSDKNVFTGQVKDMTYLFRDSTFNSNINYWDVSNVESMSYMFRNAQNFNQPLNDWDVSSVRGMHSTFYGARSFNQPLNDWDVSSVEHMNDMFHGANSFNQSLNDWDVSSVEHMNYMFLGANSFNQPLNDWNVSNVESMSYMFHGANSFNQSLNDWDVSSVEHMNYMFLGARSFNQPLNDWNVSNVESMSYMFRNAQNFNQPLNDWNVSSVEHMNYMFYGADSFNQDIGEWDVGSVTNMNYMFYDADSFNQDIGEWDVGSVTNMAYMFYGALDFNQDLTNWCVSGISEEPVLFKNGSPLTHANSPKWGQSCSN